MNNELKPRLSENFTVRSFDLDLSSRLKISSMFGFFQEIAGKHADHLGVGYDRLIKDNMAWMLSRIYVKFHDFPSWKDELQLETWPLGMDRLFFRRDFYINCREKRIVSASSYWLLINLEKMRPCTIPVNEDVILENSGRFAIHGKMEEIPSPAGDKFNELNITYSLLDRNRHVNNTRYADWVMDEIGFESLEKSAPRFFAIEYRQQVTPFDKVLVRHSKNAEGSYLVEGIIKETSKTCFRARVDF